MDEYTSFASVYDLFMDNVPYEEWTRFITKKLNREGIKNGTVVDLGCGTGTLTRLLRSSGYQMIGVEISPEMLSMAMQAEDLSQEPILYLNQDIRELELAEPVEAIISTCDTLNYVTEVKELKEVFSLVFRHLKEEGVFFFDFNTEYKYREVLGQETIGESRDTGAFIWDNYYDEEERLNEYEVTFFIQEKGELFRRHREVHLQRAYDIEEMRTFLEEVGFVVSSCYDDYTEAGAREQSERVCLVAKKKADKE